VRFYGWQPGGSRWASRPGVHRRATAALAVSEFTALSRGWQAGATMLTCGDCSDCSDHCILPPQGVKNGQYQREKRSA
jgi:hypothetical protein